MWGVCPFCRLIGAAGGDSSRLRCGEMGGALALFLVVGVGRWPYFQVGMSDGAVFGFPYSGESFISGR